MKGSESSSSLWFQSLPWSLKTSRIGSTTPKILRRFLSQTTMNVPVPSANTAMCPSLTVRALTAPTFLSPRIKPIAPSPCQLMNQGTCPLPAPLPPPQLSLPQMKSSRFLFRSLPSQIWIAKCFKGPHNANIHSANMNVTW